MKEMTCTECEGSGEVPDPAASFAMETCLNCWGLGWVEVFSNDDYLPEVSDVVEWDCD